MTRDQNAKLYQLSVAVEIAASKYKRQLAAMSVTRTVTVADLARERIACAQLEVAVENLKLYRESI